jgi:hypothetical protein
MSPPRRGPLSSREGYVFSELVDPWSEWAPDAESFERTCLADLERQLGHPVTVQMMRDDPVRRELREVRLDGSYPETAVVVNFLDLDSGTVEEWRYPLWEKWFRLPDGTMLSPDAIAGDIWLMLIEP